MSKIVFILCIVGLCMCVLSLVMFLIVGDRSLKIGGVNIYGMIAQETGVSVSPAMVYTALGCAIITCLSETILAKMAMNYFSRELADGTPFTFRGAKELKRLGLLTIFLPLGVAFVCAIVFGAVTVMSTGSELSKNTQINVGTGTSIGLGIGMLIVSVFCRHGAETQQSMNGQYGAGQQYGANTQYGTNPEWNPNPQWNQQQTNQAWANQQAQMNQQWANQQAQANQQWSQQQTPADKFRQE